VDLSLFYSIIIEDIQMKNNLPILKFSRLYGLAAFIFQILLQW
jgi:hypothetical protein